MNLHSVQCKEACEKYYVLKATNSYCTTLGEWGDGTENSQGDCKPCPAARYGASTGLTSCTVCIVFHMKFTTN